MEMHMAKRKKLKQAITEKDAVIAGLEHRLAVNETQMNNLLAELIRLRLAYQDISLALRIASGVTTEEEAAYEAEFHNQMIKMAEVEPEEMLPDLKPDMSLCSG